MKIKLSQFEAAQLILQTTATLTSGVLANPKFRPNLDHNVIMQDMQDISKLVLEVFDVLGIEVKN